MNISSTGNVSNTSSSQGVLTNPTSALGGDQFMMLLLAQLRNQNPLEPMDDKDMMAQFTQLNSLEELQKINDGLQGLYRSNQLTEAAGLIGKEVEISTGDGQSQTGVVSGVSLVEGQVMLWLNDLMVPLSSLITVRAQQPDNEV